MSEQRAFELLKKHLIKPNPVRRRIGRLENVVGVGWPDVNGCFEGSEFWIEIKEPTEPKRATTKLFGSNHKVTLEQRNWIKAQLLAGGLAYIYIDTGKHRLFISGKLADEINEMTLTEIVNSEHCIWWCKTPLRDEKEWEKVAHAIINRKI